MNTLRDLVLEQGVVDIIMDYKKSIEDFERYNIVWDMTDSFNEWKYSGSVIHIQINPIVKEKKLYLTIIVKKEDLDLFIKETYFVGKILPDEIYVKII